MLNLKKKVMAGIVLFLLTFAFVLPFGGTTVRAADSTSSETTVAAEKVKADAASKSGKATSAAIAIGLAAAAGAIGMGIAIGKSAEGIARQPEADGKIRTTLMLGLVFIETAIIYALIVAILVIFVL